ncbi:MAG: MliC family protein [Campylobacteraceae bacterium]|jgi:hypothetical protein|nr:MliC family protein [Campylobacteraceae bacterium]
MKKSIWAISILLFLSGCYDKKDVIDNAIIGEDGSVIRVVFYDDRANITLPDDSSVLLKGIPMASGIKYANSEYEYSEWHGEIELKKDNKTIFKAKNDF